MTLHDPWTVYLVDDDALFFEMTVKQSHLDCKVSRCANGEDFISKLGTNQKVATSLVFLDLTLPSLSDIEILLQVRTLPFSSQFPVFILSGSQSPGAIARAYKPGVTGYVLKPAFEDQWASMLDRAIYFGKKLLTKS